MKSPCPMNVAGPPGCRRAPRPLAKEAEIGADEQQRLTLAQDTHTRLWSQRSDADSVAVGNLRRGVKTPLDLPVEIELILSEEQITALAGVIESQQSNPGSQTFMVLASSYVPELRRGTLRLQAKLVPKREAQKALKILREAKLV
jgi:hypothetical protein